MLLFSVALACSPAPAIFAADNTTSIAPSAPTTASTTTTTSASVPAPAPASASAITSAPTTATATASASAPATATAPARNPRWAVLVDKSLNLYRVTPTLYRCEQFTKKQVPALQKLGIRAAVDLRHNHTDDDLLKDSGIKAVRVPTNTWAIDDAHIIAALADIRRAEADGDAPVVVHCEHGADRTGVVCAMYRVVYQGWTPAEAIDELRHGGYGFHWIWFNIPRYIQKADAQKIAAAVNAKLAAP